MRFWIVTPRGQFAPVMGELRPSRESAERYLALGLTDQRRPLYEVLEVELLRADALGSSEVTSTETRSAATNQGTGPASQGEGKGNSSNKDEDVLKGDQQGNNTLLEVIDQDLDRQGQNGGGARHRLWQSPASGDDFPWSSVAAPGLQGATERDPPPRGAAELHPVLKGAGQGPEDIDRTLEQANKQGQDLPDPIDDGLPPEAGQTTTGLRDTFEPQACRSGGEQKGMALLKVWEPNPTRQERAPSDEVQAGPSVPLERGQQQTTSHLELRALQKGVQS